MERSPILACDCCGARGSVAAEIPHDTFCPGRVFAHHVRALIHTGFEAGAI